MQFLNIYTYKDEKDNSIKIRLDVIREDRLYNYIAIPHNLNILKSKQFSAIDKEIIQDVYSCSNADILEKALLPSEYSEMLFKVTIQTLQTFTLGLNTETSGITSCREETKVYKHSGVTYTLSTIPSVAMYQIWSFCTSAIPGNQMKDTTIYFNASLFEYFQGKGELASLELSLEFDKKNAVDESLAVASFLQNILQCGEMKQYQHTLDTIKIITGHYIEQKPNNGRLLDCLNVEKRCMLLHKPLTEIFLNPQITNFKKINSLLAHARTLIAKDQKEELNYQIHSLHALAKKQLIAPCIGKLSHEGFTQKNQNTYAADYTELEFLHHAQFTLRDDGRISIINIQSNQSYLKAYAPGKRNHGGLLKEEMLYLGPIIGLEFDTDSDFENELIFTRDCSKALQEKGLHLTLNYIKSLLFAQNQSLFFTRHSLFNNLPKELYPNIVDKKMPLQGEELAAILDEREINAMTPMKVG